MDEMCKMVQEFQDKFETPNEPEFWIGLVKEELNETKEAAAHLLKEVCDIGYTVAGLVNHVGEKEAQRLLEEAGIGEFGTVLNDLIDAFGEDIFAEAFIRVHTSNMSKLDDNGNVTRREDGKVLKGPNYKPPVLDDLIV